MNERLGFSKRGKFMPVERKFFTFKGMDGNSKKINSCFYFNSAKAVLVPIVLVIKSISNFGLLAGEYSRP